MTNNGIIKINSDIILNIAALATLEIDGVSEVIGFNPHNSDISKSAIENKILSMRLIDRDVYINLAIRVKNGYRIPELASKIQDSVINQVEIMTSLNVKEVNITVDGTIK